MGLLRNGKHSRLKPFRFASEVPELRVVSIFTPDGVKQMFVRRVPLRVFHSGAGRFDPPRALSLRTFVGNSHTSVYAILHAGNGSWAVDTPFLSNLPDSVTGEDLAALLSEAGALKVLENMSAPVFDGTVGDRLVNMTGRKPKKSIKGDLDTDDDNERREFRQILKEVEALGTSRLGWKERKALEQKKAEALGAKPKKGWKTPFSLGLNIKRKREEAESAKVEEQLAGLRPNKSRKRSPHKERAEDKGLIASEGRFKGGVLYVQPLVKKPVETKGRSSDRSLDRVFNDGKTKKGKKGKGKSKGKGAKKGGGKKKR